MKKILLPAPLLTAGFVGMLIGLLVLWGIYSLGLYGPRAGVTTESNTDSMLSSTEQTDRQRQPAYWVAPMDANYRRDKPGKSPMGMDLVPVYVDKPSRQSAAYSSAASAVTIAPELVNNLGVRSAQVVRHSLAIPMKTVGYVQYDEDKFIHIHPRVEGWIEKLYIKAAGDPVEKFQPLYELYSPELVNAQEELLLALKRREPRLIDAAEQKLKALQVAEVTIARLKKTRQVQQTVTFFSPQAGVVDNLNIREGFFVKPGTLLMSIGALDSVWVEAEMFAAQAAQVKTGLPVTMTLDYMPGHQWRGQVDYIYPSLNAEMRTVKIRSRFSNQDLQLKPNMFAQILIHARTEEDSLLVPREAVIRTGSQERVVLDLGDGRFRSVLVKIGRVTEQWIEILAGLEQGQQIVVSAQFLLDSESSKAADFSRMQGSSQVTGGAAMNHAGMRAVDVHKPAIDHSAHQQGAEEPTP